MEAVMIVESEEFAPSSRGMVVADDSDSTPSSSKGKHNSLQTNQRKERRHRSPAKKRQLSKRKLRVSYRSLDQKKKLKHSAARKLKEASKFLAIKYRVDREEGVTPQKLRYLEELARENERERIRHEIIMQRMNAMQRDMQLMMAVAAQVGMTDDYDFIFNM